MATASIEIPLLVAIDKFTPLQQSSRRPVGKGVSAFAEGVSIEGLGRSRCWASTCELVDDGGAAAGRHMGAISKAGHVRAPRSSRGLMLAGCVCGRDRLAARRAHGFRLNDCRLECAALQKACFTAVSNGHRKANRKAGISL